ncbi:MAG: helix-hairpin-helix domain-containing protein [Bacteroidia bacterium]|nr:helix-hairpin-helix domain-containing protein [Bacteroidia bacterium]QQR96336.1 MAG: helix-hairpin-helix domain-containing protein [Bacteroidota bacterium]MBP7713931.1 helix-hairpin-helix domain-containing protein [Bacteroidia bacterium]MBP8668112.1 helix-hairpin-helix domain-containing protein [Bacteroidia bacterium]HOZ82606.1 helix-hairpin-helix domain-containing protein [Bacteroidia bacterium]
MKKKPPFHNLRSIFKQYNTFTYSERKGIIVLSIIIVVLLLTLYGLKFYEPPIAINTSRLDSAVAQWNLLQADSIVVKDATKLSENNSPQTTRILFPFNPNNLADSLWTKLGLSEKQIASIKKYEERGGKFRIRSDVKKLFVITPSFYDSIYSFILLPDSMPTFAQNKYQQDSIKVKKEWTIEPIEINLADEEEWQKLPAIGPGRAAAIVSYRNKLGGFTSINQLHEVNAIVDSVFEKISPYLLCNIKPIQKKNINTDDAFSLRHPYISSSLATIIVNYRKMHGDYKSTEQLRDLKIIKPEDFEKLAPYIVVGF